MLELRVWRAKDGDWYVRYGDEWFAFDDAYRCTDYATKRDPETRIPWARTILRTVLEES